MRRNYDSRHVGSHISMRGYDIVRSFEAIMEEGNRHEIAWC